MPITIDPEDVHPNYFALCAVMVAVAEAPESISDAEISEIGARGSGIFRSRPNSGISISGGHSFRVGTQSYLESRAQWR